MTKSKKQTFSPAVMLIASIIVTIVASITLGIVMSYSQPYAPLPSREELAVVFTTLTLCGAFSGYTYYKHINHQNLRMKLVRAAYLGIGTLIIGALLAHLIRMISV